MAPDGSAGSNSPQKPTVNAFDAGLDGREDRHADELATLDLLPFDRKNRGNSLESLNAVVVGGGPAGLTFARIAHANGARVTVLEKAGDPRGEDAGYTNRSFNLSLDRVGRYVLGDHAAWQGGIRVVGRAIHNYQDSGSVFYTDYGSSPDADLINIPRPRLRQNMVTLTLEEGVTIKFNSKVSSLDPDTGTVTYEDGDGGTESLSADLIVVCDGLHSIADGLIKAQSGEDFYHRPELRRIVSALVFPQDNRDLSLHHIHFWYEPGSDSFAVGVPNRDGSVALLMASPYTDKKEGSGLVATTEAAAEHLQRDFPQLFDAYPQLAQQLPDQKVYHFQYKAHSTFRVGKRGVIVGDAAYVMPPWASYGANGAMASASSLVYHLVKRRGDIDAALDDFQDHQRLLSRSMLDYANDHGKFFSGPVMESPNKRSDPALAQLIADTGQQLEKR